ncbi:MAG: elongation factor G [Pirellulales bacterium]|nr:elongation factor G [Pirellulales bacterium]
MARDIATLRNIGIIAHIDAGKTTLTDQMLYYTGAKHKAGEVDSGTTDTDFDPEEQQRGITIYSACVTFNWHGVVVNLIDTPGHVDFTAEVERSLRVLDGGVVVFSAREGVEAQSETVWQQADKYHVPRMAFINKMDREGADFYATLGQIKKRLGASPVATQIPYGSGPSHVKDPFRGVIDLISMQLLTFSTDQKDPEAHKQITTSPIPDDAKEDADEWRATLIDQLSHLSDELMELALEEKEIPAQLIRGVIRDGTIQSQIVPVLCGSALNQMGVQPVLDGVKEYLPSPADLPPVEGIDPKNPEKTLRRRTDDNEPFCGLVFKIVADRHGDLYFVRVYSGTLKGNTRVLNPGKDVKENIAQLWHLQADKREQVSSVEAGDIVGIIGLRNSVTGDTLCDSKRPVLLESISFPETVISMAIEPETSAERKKLAERLEMLKRQDPTFKATESEDTGQTLISGMGELHLEIIKNRLLRDFKLDVKVHKPRVSYRETVAAPVEAVGECHRQMAGKTHFARLRIRLEPQQSGESATIDPAATGEIAGEFLSPAMESLRDQLQGGGKFGHPLMNVKATVLGGEVSESESTDIAFQIAAADAFYKALDAAESVSLEPVMKLNINTPDDCMGDFIGDLQQRRGTIHKTEIRGSRVTILAEAPLEELFGYSTAMGSLSHGRASGTMEPSHYGPAPAAVAGRFA